MLQCITVAPREGSVWLGGRVVGFGGFVFKSRSDTQEVKCHT